MNFAEMVLKQTAKDSQPKPKPQPRMYGLYQHQGEKWVRVTSLTAKKDSMVKLCQNILLASVFDGWPELRLMPVRSENEAIGEIIKVH